MTKSLKDFMDSFSEEDLEKIDIRAKDLIEEEHSLRSLRKAHELTQERMAELLGVKQENVSRLEKRSDLLLSTLSSYIEAMGGTLKLVANFPNRPEVVIKTLSDIK